MDNEGLAKKVRLTDYYASWCIPCQDFAPAVEELEQRYGEKVDFVKVDVGEGRGFNKEKMQEHRLWAVPTLVLEVYLGATWREAFRLVGPEPKDTPLLSEMIERFLGSV